MIRRYPERPPDRARVIARDRYEPQADQERFIVPLLKQRIEVALVGHGRPGAGARVLDVGCGRQPFASLLEHLGYRYFALDVHQNPEGNVQFVCAIDEDLPQELAGERFDLVVCFEVLEHVADWSKAFANLATLMSPGASLLVTCPAFYPLHEEPYDFWRPTPHALARFASSVGLTVNWIDTAGSGWDVFGTALTLAAPRPATDSLVARAAAKGLDVARRLAFRSLRAGWPQRFVSLEGQLYLSNVAWFQKPSSVHA